MNMQCAQHKVINALILLVHILLQACRIPLAYLAAGMLREEDRAVAFAVPPYPLVGLEAAPGTAV